MRTRDVALIAGGAALAATMVVMSYEGKAYLAREPSMQDRRVGIIEVPPCGPSNSEETRRATEEATTVPAETSNGKVDEYAGTHGRETELRTQLEQVSVKLRDVQRERRDLEAQIRSLESELGQAPHGYSANEFDLDENDWKELAKEGRIKYRVPCGRLCVHCV